jgi:glycosyltransferase involved in cell wall biosynthesis
MKILFACADQDSLAYYRCAAPGRFLQRYGYARVCVTRSWNKEHVDWADLVVLQRLLGDVIANVAGYCRMRGKKVVFECDDNILRYPDSPEYRDERLKGVPDRAKRVVAECDAVFCSTREIARAFREECGKPAYVLRNALVFEDIGGRDDLTPVKKEGELVVGWFGGHYHYDDLEMILGALMRVLDDFPDVRLSFLGMLPRRVYEHAPDRVFFQGFVPFGRFWDVLHRMGMDVVLAPLYPTEFAMGRSNLRLLQCGAAGVPVVASDHGEYGRTAREEGFPCVLAGDETQWYEAIAWLLCDREARMETARRARQFVRSRYSMDTVVEEWASAVREVCADVSCGQEGKDLRGCELYGANL